MSAFIKKTGLGAGTGVKLGGAEADKWDDTFNDVNTGVTAKINIPFIFRDDRLKLYDSSGNSFQITVSTPALTANRQLSIPVLPADDTLMTLGTFHSIPASCYIYKSGATYFLVDGATNTTTSSASLQSLLTTCIAGMPAGGSIWFGAGDFTLSTLLTITTSNITIRGSGVDVTRLVIATPTTTATSIRIGTTALGTVYTVTVNALKGQRVITVASSAGIVAGDWIFLTRLVAVDASSATRYDAEFHKVLSVTSTTVTVEDNLMEDFNTTDTAAFYEVPWTKNFQLHDLTITDSRADNTVATADDGPFHCVFNFGLYLHNVKLEKMAHDSIRVESCFNTILDNVYMETPTSVADDLDHQYGLYITGASTNTSWTGGWANRCRHSVTCNTNSGGVYRRGRQRNIAITGITSFNANVAHFDMHQAALGVTFTGCTALAGQHSSVSVDVQGFNLRSPAVINGCVVQGATHEAIVLWIDGDVVGSDLTPGANRTIINATSIISPLKDDADTVRRGIVVQGNRSSVIISNCQFYDINQESIRLEDPCSNVIITGNMFHSCGSSLVSTNGIIRVDGTGNDIIITNNIFGAGTPPPTGRPLAVATAANRLIFQGNNVNGLTNKAPTITAISTDINVRDNSGLNPINKITNHTNTTQNTIGFYGGTTATPVASTDYTIVGGNILITSTGGTGVSITLKDGAGNTVVSALTTLSAQAVPLGFKINFGPFSSPPSVTVFST